MRQAEAREMTVGPPRKLSGASLPSALRDLPEPPDSLYVHGEIPRGPRIGIVGTRTPTPEAREYAVLLASHLAARGVAIVSGGAEGIDAAAHEGALQAGGVTVVVAPSSFDCPFPKEHAELFARIVERGGAYLSPFEAQVKPQRHEFFTRNSYLVALSHALIVVEAPIRSGARNAALWARELGRTCFVVPAVPWNANGLGCIAELQLGARALASPDEVLRWLEQRNLHAVASVEAEAAVASAADTASERTGKRSSRKRAAAPRGLFGDPVLDAIVAALGAGPRHPDQIGQAAGLSAAALSHGLLLLTLQGVVLQTPAGTIRLVD